MIAVLLVRDHSVELQGAVQVLRPAQVPVLQLELVQEQQLVRVFELQLV